jgi:hypothetical protein
MSSFLAGRTAVLLALALSPGAFPALFAAGPEPASPDEHQAVEFEGRQWETDSAAHVSVAECKGHTSLCLKAGTSAYAYLPDVEFRDGTIEVDMATDSRGWAGIAFRGREDAECDRVLILPQRERPVQTAGMVEEAVIRRDRGSLLLLRVGLPAAREAGQRATLGGWLHAKIVVRGTALEVYLDHGEEPALAVDRMLDGTSQGTIGVWGRNAQFANFRFSVSR